MKRIGDDVAGMPPFERRTAVAVGTGLPPADVAGATQLRAHTDDVASFRHALDDPMGTAQEDAELLADFADFMGFDGDFERCGLLPPDPGFRERLRRRLWRTHVMTRLRDRRDEPH